MRHTLSEVESKRILAAHGVPVIEERTATDPDGAVDAARALGYPVAVKLCGTGITHKTERGLVRLALGADDAVRATATQLLAAARTEDGPVELLVARMAHGSRELIAGLHTDPQFGRSVMVGIGGVFAEAIGDVAFRLVPIARVDAEDMLDELENQAVLGAWRGEPPVDRAAVAEVLLGLSRLAEAEPGVVSVDVNPLVVVDGRPLAVDALVEQAR
jgi:acetate---CoA ligase (ADP-forming) subunit beta